MPARTIGIMLLTCALVGWVAMAPGAAARQPTEATGPTADAQLAKPPALSPSVLATRELSAHPQMAQGASAGDVTRAMSLPTTVSPKNPKIDSHLVDLSTADDVHRIASGVGVEAPNLSSLPVDLQSMVEAGQMRIDDSGRVQVYVDSQVNEMATVAAVQAVRGVVQRQDSRDGIVQAFVPIVQVKELAASPAVRFIRLPDYGSPQAGSVTTQGDSILKQISPGRITESMVLGFGWG